LCLCLCKKNRRILEKTYSDEAVVTDDGTIKLAIKALMEVVESGSKNIEIAILNRDKDLRFLEESDVDAFVKKIEEEKAAEELKK